MSKLTILLFGLLVVLAISASTKNDEQSLSQKYAREASTGRKVKKSFKPKKNNERFGKKKKMSRKNGKNRQSKKYGIKKLGKKNGMKKDDKIQNAREASTGRKAKKSFKPNKNKKKFGKNKKMSRKNGKNKQSKKKLGKKNGMRKGNKIQRQSSNCVDDMNYFIDKFWVQYKNIVNQINRIKNKNTKKIPRKKLEYAGNFTVVAHSLASIGGGSRTAQKCAGSLEGLAADKTELTDSLFDCEETLSISCSSELFTYNETLVADCDSLVKKFKTEAEGCQGLSDEAESCNCWTSVNLKDLYDKLRDKCKNPIKDLNDQISTRRKKCIKDFQACKKNEASSFKYAHLCSFETKSVTSCLACIPAVLSAVSSCGNPIKDPTGFFSCIAGKIAGSCLGCACELICTLFPEVCEFCALGAANIESTDCVTCVDGNCINPPGNHSCPSPVVASGLPSNSSHCEVCANGKCVVPFSNVTCANSNSRADINFRGQVPSGFCLLCGPVGICLIPPGVSLSCGLANAGLLINSEASSTLSTAVSANTPCIVCAGPICIFPPGIGSCPLFSDETCEVDSSTAIQTSLSLALESECKCPTGFGPIKTVTGVCKCFLYSPSKTNQFDAQRSCVGFAPGNGGSLASIHEVKINNHLANLASGLPAWIGGVKAGNDWTWNDGTPFAYTNWAPGKPDGGDAIYINHGYGLWDDWNPNALRFAYICEADPISSPSTSAPAPAPAPAPPSTTPASAPATTRRIRKNRTF